jgi:enamine deaminase RidA (YjgF/YER057c/UK114 family)
VNNHFAHDDSDLREGRYQSAAYDRHAVDGTGAVSRLRGLLREYLKLRGARFGVYGITLAAFLGRIGGELSVEDGRRATHLATLNALALARTHLGSLDRVRRVVRLAVSLVTTPEFRQHPKVADAASALLAGVFGAEKTSTRMVYGMTSLPVGVCVVVELILEVGT